MQYEFLFGTVEKEGTQRSRSMGPLTLYSRERKTERERERERERNRWECIYRVSEGESVEIYIGRTARMLRQINMLSQFSYPISLI